MSLYRISSDDVQYVGRAIEIRFNSTPLLLRTDFNACVGQDVFGL